MAAYTPSINPVTGQPYASQSEEQSANLESQNQKLQDMISSYQKLAELSKGASALGGPELQYNPLQRLVRKADGSIAPIDDKYKLQEGESEEARLKDSYQVKGGDDYLKQLLLKQGESENFARDNAASQGQSALANANSSLGMRGGLNTANRANLARGNMRDSLIAQQNVAKQGMSDRADIGIKGAEMNQDADKLNNSNLLTSVGGVNQFNLNKYKQQMNVQASQSQADATRAAGGGGGSWICTEVAKRYKLSLSDIRSLAKFKRYSLAKDAETSKFYLYGCSPLVEKMVEKGDDWGRNASFVHGIVTLVQDGQMDTAFNVFMNTVASKITNFWPECDHKVYLNFVGGK